MLKEELWAIWSANGETFIHASRVLNQKLEAKLGK